MRVYEVKNWRSRTEVEFTNEQRARKAAELLFRKTGSPSELIHWNVEHNLPRCKPDLVYRSCSLETFDGTWWTYDIHGPGTSKWKTFRLPVKI